MISALLFTSCVDLNLNPLSEGSSENWYSSASEIEMSLNDFYRTAFFPIDGQVWGDDAAWRSNTQLVWNGTMTSENSTIGTRWQNYYKGIARALRIINNLDAKGGDLGLSDAKLQQYKGEAYFYLGYAYGMLAFHWGDVILRTASQIRSDIRSAFAGAAPRDVSLLFYSGHGCEGLYGSRCILPAR